MITIIQRVTHANVNIAGTEVGRIERGIMALIAIEKNDTEKLARRLLERILNLKTIQGGLLLVPQFTLAADTNSGNRPSFTAAATPEKGEQLFSYLVTHAKELYPTTETGVFGADMQVSLLNDGPVTFTLTV